MNAAPLPIHEIIAGIMDSADNDDTAEDHINVIANMQLSSKNYVDMRARVNIETAELSSDTTETAETYDEEVLPSDRGLYSFFQADDECCLSVSSDVSERRKQRLRRRRDCGANETTYLRRRHPSNWIRGPTLVALSFAGLLLPVLLAASYYTLFIMALMVVGFTVTLIDMRNMFFIRVHRCLYQWYKYADTMVLDETLHKITKRINGFLIGIIGAHGIYSLPISKKRRMEIIDAVLKISSTNGVDQAASDVLSMPGGMVDFFPNDWRKWALLNECHEEELASCASLISPGDSSVSRNDNNDGMHRENTDQNFKNSTRLRHNVHRNKVDFPSPVSGHTCNNLPSPLTLCSSRPLEVLSSRICQSFTMLLMQRSRRALQNIDYVAVGGVGTVSALLLLLQIRRRRSALKMIYNVARGVGLASSAGVCAAAVSLLVGRALLSEHNDGLSNSAIVCKEESQKRSRRRSSSVTENEVEASKTKRTQLLEWIQYLYSDSFCHIRLKRFFSLIIVWQLMTSLRKRSRITPSATQLHYGR